MCSYEKEMDKIKWFYTCRIIDCRSNYRSTGRHLYSDLHFSTGKGSRSHRPVRCPVSLCRSHDGSCEVSYNPQGDSVVLNWSGKSTGSGNTGGGTSGGTAGGNNNQGISGTGDNTGSGDNNQGNTGGNTGGSTGGNTSGSDQGNNNSNGNSNDNNSDILSPSQITYKQLTTNAEDLPTADNNYIRGQIYKYNGKLYICNVGGYQPIAQWFNPEINATEQFPAFEETYFDNILTDSDLDPASGNFKNQIASGQIYQDKNGNYFMFIASSIPTYSSTPTDSAYGASDKWIPILPDTHKRS